MQQKTTHCERSRIRLCRSDIRPQCYSEHLCNTVEKWSSSSVAFLWPNGFDPRPLRRIVKKPTALFIAAAIATVAVIPMARPAQADTTSTVLLAAAAGAIIGSLFTDGNNQPYYVNNGRHVYVSNNTANYYRAHGNNRNHGPQRDGHNSQNDMQRR